MKSQYQLYLKTAVLLASAAVLSACGGEAKHEVSRTVLVKQALTNVPGKEGQIVMVEVPPGTTTGKHRHPVDEFIYVLEGEGELQRPDAATTSVKAGQSMVLNSGQVHEMKNARSDRALKFLQFSVPSPGEPLATPVN